MRVSLSTLLTLTSAVRIQANSIVLKDESSAASCRYLPGDAGWPKAEDWAQLNSSVSGRLIATTPPSAYVCHDPTYDETACAQLRERWDYPEAHFDDPSAFMSAYHQNASCDPYTPQSSPCLQGNYVEYAINVTTPEDAIAGVKFAEEKNIRLVVKNTGHDYLGKSTGKGALSLWLHHLKSISFSNHTSPYYTGPAVTYGAGVQAFEAFEAADKVGLQVVGGQCVTTGIAGGYTQGGGHSTLTSVHGLGADQTLSYTAVTANGTLLTASPIENSDLYWALSGGGGGTFAVVLSLTAKAYPDTRTGGASFALYPAASNLSQDAFWNVVERLHTDLPAIVDAGAHVQFAVLPQALIVNEATIPGATEDDMRRIFAPFTDYLDERNILYQLNVTSYPTFLEHADKYLGPLPYGQTPSAQINGGVMVARSVVLSQTAPLVSVIRDIASTTNFIVASYALDASLKPGALDNAVLPAWRDMLTYYVVLQMWNYTVPVADMVEQQRQLTEEVMPKMQEYASGAYLSEADFQNPRWREEFYGDNWEKLNEIKSKYDEKALLYATTAVGSDAWTVAGDGRLCRT